MDVSMYEKMPHNMSKLTGLPKQLLSKKKLWIVTEKVHGANFSFICDGTTIQCSKRRGVLTPEEDFFGYQTVLAKYRLRVLELTQELLKAHPEVTCVRIYGELFGGGWPSSKTSTHEEKEEQQTYSIVQTEIFYCPHVDFYGFDIAVESKTDRILRKSYLDTTVANAMFIKHAFIYAKPLLIGCLSECLEFKDSFPTTVPALFGLPNLNGNLAEGVVVRPIKNTLCGKGNKLRAIFKRKSTKFTERVLDFATDQATSTSKYIQGKKGNSFDAQLVQRVTQELNSYVSKHRISALSSKLGPLDIYVNPDRSSGHGGRGGAGGGRGNKSKRKKKKSVTIVTSEDVSVARKRTRQERKRELFRLFADDCLEDALTEGAFAVMWSQLTRAQNSSIIKSHFAAIESLFQTHMPSI